MIDNENNKYYLVNVDAVKKALTTLANVRSHEHFPGYLALLRDRYKSNSATNSETIVKFYKDFLYVSDAPDNRPFLRPFRSRGVGNPITLNQSNVAGSYAPSSIRNNGPLSKIIKIKNTAGTTNYELLSEHWKIVLTEMLSGHKLPIISTAIFILRDYAFQIPKQNIEDLISIFRIEFSISKATKDGDDIYEALFYDDSSEYSNQDLVELKSEIGSSDNLIKIRALKLVDLGMGDLLHLKSTENTISHQEVEIEDNSLLEKDDIVLSQVKRAIELGYAGVIISGSPGTGKSWYAQQIGVSLSGSWRAVRTVQFHPSYQYEDFVFGYVAQKDGTFLLTAKEFVIACREAAADHERMHILIIDEISRTDIIRVFGEALTYLERDKRDQPFMTASGEELTVPSNLILIGTMNPWDKGVDEIDIALERRFAQIDLNPSVEILKKLLLQKTTDSFVNRIIDFFAKLNRYELEEVRLGHAYFLKCLDKESALDIWRFRIRPTLKRACRLNRELFERIELDWQNIVVAPPQEVVEKAESDEVLPAVEQPLNK